MIGQVMREVRNFFEDGEPIEGTFSITDGTLSPLDGVASVQYVAICGSTLHDGVYLCADGVLTGCTGPDETFTGRVYTLHPPRDFVRLCEQVKAYTEHMPDVAVTAESFGAYSRTLAQGKCGPVTWQQRFRSQLAPYRHMFTEVPL